MPLNQTEKIKPMQMPEVNCPHLLFPTNIAIDTGQESSQETASIPTDSSQADGQLPSFSPLLCSSAQMTVILAGPRLQKHIQLKPSPVSTALLSRLEISQKW